MEANCKLCEMPKEINFTEPEVEGDDVVHTLKFGTTLGFPVRLD